MMQEGQQASAPIQPRGRGQRVLGRIFLTIGLLWVLGLLLYIAQLQSYASLGAIDAVPAAEAVVVLTGGSERVEEGIRLLAAGKGKKLLISGVAHGVTLKQVLARERMMENRPTSQLVDSLVSDDLRTCCITLGYVADNTIGNAQEARVWMEKEGFSSLILVTAHYHMPRSLLFFRKGLPDVRVIPYPVFPDSVKLDSWWQRSGTLSLLVLEYNKYLVAQVQTLIFSFQS